jgi:tripartite-type tricarboxylate transporter receptor subunit TctC
MKTKTSLALAAIMGMLFFAATPRAGADDFYQGKTIRFIVGFAAGGGFDTYTRLIARHFGKHVPGNPDTVVENMTGAGSLVAANYIYNKAERDGTIIGNWIGPLVLQQILGNKAAKFDGRKFGWLGVPTADSGVCALTTASGIRNMKDWFASKRPIKIGGTAPGSTTDDVPKIVRAAIDLPLKVIEGYSGTAKVRLAAESGEIDGGCWAWESIKPTWAKALQSGEVHIVLQTMLESNPELKDVPLAITYAKTDETRQLLGVVDGPYGVLARPYSVPPGLPAERLQILQKAFMDTLKDPELLAEAKKSKIEIHPVDGATISNKVADLYQMKSGLKDKLRDIIMPKTTHTM